MESRPRPSHTTTDAGIPAPDDDISLTVGPAGPVLLQDHYLIQKLGQFNRERIPERVVHAKGGGAYGYFEVTEEVSRWTKASFLSAVGKRTPLFVRFSTVTGELGSADTVRDPRGFAVKFYTDEGNYDLVANNTPVFFIRDPSKFPDFISSQKRMPETGRRSNDAQWDFWTLRPESAHQVLILMSDRGTPRSWRHMNGYGGHTFMWVNTAGERFWVKYHLKSEQGTKNLSTVEATALAGSDPDHHRRDLYDAIRAEQFPAWRLEVQIMEFESAAKYRFNPFDITKVWPHADYPLFKVGRLLLDRNPKNYFAEVEQAAFSPANFVPGTGASPDRMLLGRMFAYPDAQRYRIGTNFLQLPVNRPVTPVRSYSKDGAMRFDHAGNQPPYAPNSYGGPRADRRLGADVAWDAQGDIGRHAQVQHAEDSDFVQAGNFWRDVLDDDAKNRLVSNISGHLRNGVSEAVVLRAVHYLTSIDSSLGNMVREELGSTVRLQQKA